MDNSQLYCNVEWLLSMVKYYVNKTSVVLVSEILAFGHKKDAIKQILKKILSLCCFYINLKTACEIAI